MLHERRLRPVRAGRPAQEKKVATSTTVELPYANVIKNKSRVKLKKKIPNLGTFAV